MGKVRLCQFKGGFKWKGKINRVIIDVIAEINFRCNYLQVLIII